MDSERLKPGLLYALLLFLGLSAVGSAYFYRHFISPDHFVAGVEIGGISVQGLSQEQAAVELSQAISVLYTVPITFYKDDYLHDSRLGDLCLPLDARDIVASVWTEERGRGWMDKISNWKGERKVSYPVLLPYDTAAQDILLQEWESRWGVPAQNAALEIDNQRGLIVVEGRAGAKIDGKATFGNLPQQLDKTSGVRIPITVELLEPELSGDMLQNMGEISTFSTFFNTGEINRSHNLAMAAAGINRTILGPGQVFSLNNTVGERTLVNGYLDAKIIVNGKFEPGLGGGVCQVSSTLYNACLLAGLEIIERGNHGLAVAYVPLGQDATVAFGLQDFRFKNNTDSPLYIRALTTDGKLTINIYGNLKYKQQIKVYSIVDQTLEFSTDVQFDPTLGPGETEVDHYGQAGYVVRSFRTFYNKDGTVDRTEELARDTYQALNKLILMGPEVSLIPNSA